MTDDVTIICVDGINKADENLNVLRHCKDIVDAKHVKLISYREIDSEKYGIEFIKIPYELDKLNYQRFLIKDLNKYVDTDYCLIVQSDGFISNPCAWTKKFLEFDYIGAPWPNWSHHNGIRVGNGGFSLRSKKLLEVLEKKVPIIDICVPEDFYFCVLHNKILKENGIKIANLELAAMFSYENQIPEVNVQTIYQTFGFHGCHQAGFNTRGCFKERVELIEKVTKGHFNE